MDHDYNVNESKLQINHLKIDPDPDQIFLILQKEFRKAKNERDLILKEINLLKNSINSNDINTKLIEENEFSFPFSTYNDFKEFDETLKNNKIKIFNLVNFFIF